MTETGDGGLERLRAEILRLDSEILRLAARRLEVARSVGNLKFREGLPIQDFAVEKRVLEEARRLSEALGFPAAAGEALMKPLIRSAIRVQEQDRAHRVRVQGERAVVIGGSGRMGAWFSRYLQSLGYSVGVFDPVPPPPGFVAVKDLPAAVAEASLVVVSTPPSVSRQVLQDLAGMPGDGLLFDISSLKSPLVEPLRALADQGRRVTSLHPMFGPDVELLAGRRVVVCDCGVPEANRAARELFAETTARIVEMDLAEHDALMTYVLGLSHAVNLIFNGVLAASGRSMRDLEALASSTFDAQVRIASAVARENPDLYFEIQALNDHSPGLWAAVGRQVEAWSRAVGPGDRKAFLALMGRGRAFYEEGDAP